MSGPAVTIVPSGGLPVKSVASGAPSMTAVASGGIAITLSNEGTPFVVEGGTPTPSPTPTPTPTATGTFTAHQTQWQILPEGTMGAGNGTPCTGLALCANGEWLIGTGVIGSSANTGLMRVSADFTTVLQQISVGALGLASGSAQGVCEDTTDGSYFIAVAAGNYIAHVSAAGALIGSTAFANVNGLAYDSTRDCLIVLAGGAVSWVNKSTLFATGKTGIASPGSNADQLFYDAARDELLISDGADAVAGVVRVFNCAGASAPSQIAAITCDGMLAAEGVARRGDDLIVLSDQSTHANSPAYNQVQFYHSALKANSIGVGVDGAKSVVEASGATYTVNVARYGTQVGASVSGTWAVVSGGGNPASTADFGGAFPSGAWDAGTSASTTFVVTPTDDSTVEPDETYTVNVTYSGTTVSRIGTIANDDSSLPDLPQAASLGFFVKAAPSTLAVSNAGSGTVSADGDQVGYMADQGPNGWHFTSAADNTTRTTFRTSGGVNWLEFTGGESDVLRHIGHAIDLWGASGFTLAFACRVPSFGATGKFLFGQGNSGNVNSGFLIGSSASANRTTLYAKTDTPATVIDNFTNISSTFDGSDKVLIIVGDGTTLHAYDDGVETYPAGISYDRGANGVTFNTMALGAWLRSSGLSGYLTTTSRLHGAAGWGGVQLNSTERADVRTKFGALQGRTL